MILFISILTAIVYVEHTLDQSEHYLAIVCQTKFFLARCDFAETSFSELRKEESDDCPSDKPREENDNPPKSFRNNPSNQGENLLPGCAWVPPKRHNSET